MKAKTLALLRVAAEREQRESGPVGGDDTEDLRFVIGCALGRLRQRSQSWDAVDSWLSSTIADLRAVELSES